MIIMVLNGFRIDESVKAVRPLLFAETGGCRVFCSVWTGIKKACTMGGFKGSTFLLFFIWGRIVSSFYSCELGSKMTWCPLQPHPVLILGGWQSLGCTPT